jgi:CHAT domain-containing protein
VTVHRLLAGAALTILLLGQHVHHSTDGMRPLAADSTYFRLPSLPWAEREVRALDGILPTDLYLGPDCTEEEFKNRSRDYSILHIATHTVTDERDPLNTALVWSRDPFSNEDGYLHAFELYGMEVNADLVFLSACQTGAGPYYRGEGSMSLAHGFIYAGSRNVVTGLWDIDDKTSYEITTEFYRQLANGAAPDEALRQAKLRLIEGDDPVRAAPYYWAGFVLSGK